ncbi:MAG: prepilin-type N-terminal cleavage/methylation domain-containing protein [Vicinamibacterales bacterium]
MKTHIARTTACRAEAPCCARGEGGRDERGFSIVEMLIATVIMMAVTGATFSLMNPAQGMFVAQPEVSDMQQRLRIAVDTLQKDLLMAGAGTYSGNNKLGSLGQYVATILPDREGNTSPDPAGTFKCTSTFCSSLGASDTITLMYVPPTSAQTTIRDAMPANSSELKVNAQAGCPTGDDLCGFKEGMQVMIFDETGTTDIFSITNVQTSALHLQHKGTDLSKAYAQNTYITQIAAATYWLKTDTVAETYQLMRYDGYQTDVPIAENIVGMAFEYFADPSPPFLLKSVTDPIGPWTNYGPKPPAVGVNVASDNWGAGENCLFMVSAGAHVPRTEMATPLGPVNGPLVKLSSARLTDGPWCPDDQIANRFDADLLRIRKVRVTLRVQVGLKSLRGPTGTLFTRGGTARGGERYIPDQEISFEVTPRNLNFGR